MLYFIRLEPTKKNFMNFSLSFLFLFSILIVNVVGQCGPDDLCNGHGLCQGRNGCRCDFGWRGDVCNIKIEATTVAPGATATGKSNFQQIVSKSIQKLLNCVFYYWKLFRSIVYFVDSPGVLEVALLPTAIAAGAALFCYLCSLILCCVMIRRGRNRKDPVGFNVIFNFFLKKVIYFYFSKKGLLWWSNWYFNY